MRTSLPQLLDELSMELRTTAQEHAEHRLTPRDVHARLVESMRMIEQARRLTARREDKAA